MPDNTPKHNKEIYAKFFEEPTRENFRDLVKNNYGETKSCDFKENWPDFNSISKHILGIANSGGGFIVIGVKETENKTLQSVGISKLIDKATFHNSVKKYLPDDLEMIVSLEDYHFKESEYPEIKGKIFQVIFVPNKPERIPFLSKKQGADIHANKIYIRKPGSTEEATHEQIQEILNRRIETGYSTRKELDLKQHLAQLKIIGDELGLNNSIFKQFARGSFTSTLYGISESESDYVEFLKEILIKKKIRIEEELDIKKPR